MMKAKLFLLAILVALFGVQDLHAQKKKRNKTSVESSHPLDSVASAFKFRSVGPAFMSGRVADIAIDPENDNIWYVAIGSGGVWKTLNSGTTWKPVFDDQSVYSTGCLTIDPNNRHSIWLGTGENVGGRHVSFGDGIYHSDDGGNSWKNMGLKESQHISRIIVHPSNPDIIWVAVQGPLWNSGGERGVFKSTDGGKTWRNTLYVNEWTGATEIRIDPRNPKRLYAATWQRHRNVAAYMGGGPGTAIYRSEDGGESWEKLSKGLPGSRMGKIGMCISPQRPDIIYAAIELDRRTGGVYRSTNRGASWTKMSDAVSGATGPHYYQELYASPHQFDKIYLVDVRMQISEDGGKTFRRMNESNKHSDNHAIVFRKDDPNYVLVGTDGGLYETFDGEKNWKYISNLPTVQYYKLAVDDAEPFYNIYGGTQDNNTHGGPSRTDNVHGIRNADWQITLGGDGHQPATEPGNPNIIYCESQEGHLYRVDMTNGDRTVIKPTAGRDDKYERYNWDAPILVSPHSPTRIYFASQRVWKSENRGDSWTSVSGDLTRNQERLDLEIMGSKQSWDNAWDVLAMSNYNTITSLAESPVKEGLLYAGTDDGLIQISENGGENWRKVEAGSLPGVPSTAFVNDIKSDLFDESTVYVCLDNHKYGDLRPFIFKSSDKGKTWTSLKSNLPDKTITWRLVQDHIDKDLLFLATEFGIYASLNGGEHWTKLKSGLPTISVRDLAIQRRENDLVAASFGRGFYVLDDYSALRELKDDFWEKEAIVISGRTAQWYIPKKLLGWSAKASQGAAYFTAKNPPFGVSLTYYLKDGFKSSKELRKKDKEGNSTFPGWKALEEEVREIAPQVFLHISDLDGKVVRRIKAKRSKGLHKITWDMKYTSKRAISGSQSSEVNTRPGLWAAPGKYKAQLVLLEDGKYRNLGESAEIELRQINKGSLKGKSMEELNTYWREIEKVQGNLSALNVVRRDAEKKVASMMQAAHSLSKENQSFLNTLTNLKKELDKMDIELNGFKTKNEIGEKNNPSIGNRLYIAGNTANNSTYGPTEHHLKNLKLVKEELQLRGDHLRAIANELIPGLLKKLKDAGAPFVEGMEY